MVLIIDSGSTKADFVALDDRGNFLFKTETLGLNPEVLSSDIFIERLNADNQVVSHKERFTKIFFYGAGCGTDRMKKQVFEILHGYFRKAEVIVHEDTHAAVYATNPIAERAIICILGTGSNCSFFDGKQVIQQMQSLGYLVMDDASGNRLGREMIRQYYFGNMPKDLSVLFEKEFDIYPDTVKENLYKKPNPNAYLASFSRFLIKHKDHSFCQKIISEEFELFVENYIKKYKEYTQVPVHFIGSVAFYLKEELQRVLETHQIEVGVVIQKPMDGLVDYHQKMMLS